jgi:hypothetical protein
MENQDFLDADLDSNVGKIAARRRDLLPMWIKVFTWLFMIFGAFAPLGLIAGLFGYPASLSLYGFSTMNPLSLVGLCLIALFVLKGIVAFGLWTEKDWAIRLAEADAFLGIVLCVFSMIISPLLSKEVFSLNFRIELFLLVPYILKLKRIKYDW